MNKIALPPLSYMQADMVKFAAIAIFIMLTSCTVFEGTGMQSQSSPLTNSLVILRSSGMKPESQAVIAPLSELGAKNALEEASAQRGLSFRPWDGQSFQDYDWIYNPGATFSFRVQAPAAKDCVRAVVSLWDWSGNIVYSKTYTKFPVDDILTLKAECHGVWLVTFDAYADAKGDSLKSRLVKSFGTPVDATSARALWREKNDYLLGSCFFPARYYYWKNEYSWNYPTLPKLSPPDGIERLVRLGARAGFTILRIDDHPDKASKSHDDVFHEILTCLERHDIQAFWGTGLKPKSFVGDTLELSSDFAEEDEKVSYLCENYIKPGNSIVSVVQIGNEPAHHEFWSGTREQYQWMYSYVEKKLHAANPKLLVLHGATCPAGADLGGEKLKDPAAYEIKKKTQEEWYLGFYRDMTRDAAAFGNTWAYHNHGALTSGTIGWRNWEQETLSKFGFTGNFLQTEGGACSWRPDFEMTTCNEVMQKIINAWANGEKGWMQYTLASETKPSRYGRMVSWDILHAYDFEPRFQYGTIAAMADTMAGCTFERRLYYKTNEPGPALAALFRHPKGKLIAWFSVDGKGSINVSSDARTGSLIDPMGNALDVAQPRKVTLSLQKYPQYLLLEGATWVKTER